MPNRRNEIENLTDAVQDHLVLVYRAYVSGKPDPRVTAEFCQLLKDWRDLRAKLILTTPGEPEYDGPIDDHR